MSTPINDHKKTIPPFLAGLMGDARMSMAAAQKLFRECRVEPTAPAFILPFYTRMAADLGTLIARFDDGIPKHLRARYQDQIVEAEPEQLSNIRDLYMRMLPEERDRLENLAILIQQRGGLAEILACVVHCYRNKEPFEIEWAPVMIAEEVAPGVTLVTPSN